MKGLAPKCVSAGMGNFMALLMGGCGLLVLIGLALIVPLFALLIRRPRF